MVFINFIYFSNKTQNKSIDPLKNLAKTNFKFFLQKTKLKFIQMQEKQKTFNKEAPPSPIVLPKVVSSLVIIILCALWFEYTTFSEKIRSLIISASFSLIESTFYGTTIELPNGDIIFKPFDPKCRKPHTVIKYFEKFLLLIFRLLLNFSQIFSMFPLHFISTINM